MISRASLAISFLPPDGPGQTQSCLKLAVWRGLPASGYIFQISHGLTLQEQGEVPPQPPASLSLLSYTGVSTAMWHRAHVSSNDLCTGNWRQAVHTPPPPFAFGPPFPLSSQTPACTCKPGTAACPGPCQLPLFLCPLSFSSLILFSFLSLLSSPSLRI